MRQKEWKLIITFHTTSDAGCGLAWCTVPADRADMETFLKECSIECEDMAELLY